MWPMMKDNVDIVILTKNSMPTLKYTIESLIRSDIPINKIIIVDGYSTDGTLEYLHSIKTIDIEIILDRGNRATARQRGIENVETEWFMFLDSDVILPETWFKYAKRYMDNDKIGAIWGTAINISRTTYNIYKALKYYYRTNIIRIAMLQGYKRGYTHDTLIRRDAVKDIKIPASLHTFEDHYIRRYIESRGYKYIAVFPPYCLHNHVNKKSDLKDWYLTGYYGYILGFYRRSDILKYLTQGIFKSILISLVTGDLRSSYVQYMNYLYTSIGILKSYKH